MQTDKNNMKAEQSVSIHSHALERPWKRQIVTDPKIAQRITLMDTKINGQPIKKLKQFREPFKITSGVCK